MSLGLLDLPSPLFDALDSALQIVRMPALFRVVLYAITCAWIGMRLYSRSSNQPRLTALREEIALVQRALALHDGDFAGLNALIGRNLKLSLRQLGMTLRPALIASLPLLFVMPWLSNRFDVDPPTPGSPVAVCVQPAASLRPVSATSAPVEGCWRIAWPEQSDLSFADASDTSTFNMPARPRSDIFHKFTFFNWLVGNPNGYLPDSLPADFIRLGLAPRALVPAGPVWLRGWEFWFFTVLVVVSVILKLRWKLH